MECVYCNGDYKPFDSAISIVKNLSLYCGDVYFQARCSHCGKESIFRTKIENISELEDNISKNTGISLKIK